MNGGKIIRTLLLWSAVTICGDAAAQLNESIAVEGKYEPEVVKLDRINTLPSAVNFSLPTEPLTYSEKGVTASFSPYAAGMEVTGWRATRKLSDYKGYLDLGLGSFLNSTLSAGYRFLDTSRLTAGIRFQHNSTSLSHAHLDGLRMESPRFSYDEKLGVFASSLFEGKGRLDAAIDYHLGYFNYYSFNSAGIYADAADLKAPTQTLNDIAARVGWESQHRRDDISWDAALSVRYFGFRRYYGPEAIAMSDPLEYSLVSLRGTRETNIGLCGGINFPLSSTSSVGADLDLNVVTYAGNNTDDGAEGSDMDKLSTYSMISLHPYYRFIHSDINIRVGLQADITPGIDTDKFAAFHIAPEIRADYNAGPAALYLHLLGGSRLNTMASRYEENYYCSPSLRSEVPVYSPLDATLGATFGPFSGFSAGLKLAYRISRHQYLGGWYMSALNYAGMPDAGWLDGNYLLPGKCDGEMNMHGFSIGVNASYDFGKICRIEGDFSYQPQKGETGYFNGLDRPRLIADASVTVNPWRSLKLCLAYNYRGVRTIYNNVTNTAEPNLVEATTIGGMRLPDLCMLNFGASYSFSDRVSVWVQGDNLLCRRDLWLPQLPAQGLAVTAGVALLF